MRYMFYTLIVSLAHVTCIRCYAIILEVKIVALTKETKQTYIEASRWSSSVIRGGVLSLRPSVRPAPSTPVSLRQPSWVI